MELAMHDPRMKQGWAYCSVNFSGPDHARIQDTAFVKGPGFEEMASIDVTESIPSTEPSPRKARLLYHAGL
jgi:hypothetical protein